MTCLSAALVPNSMKAGIGNDTLLGRSDAGETPAAQGGVQVFGGEPFNASDDVLQGGTGADRFRFELTLNGREDIVAKHVNADGTIDWRGVTGENNAVHDHWVESIGDDVILDFNRSRRRHDRGRRSHGRHARHHLWGCQSRWPG